MSTPVWTTLHRPLRAIRVAISPLTGYEHWTAGELTQWRWTGPEQLGWVGFVENIAGKSWTEGSRIHALDHRALPV